MKLSSYGCSFVYGCELSSPLLSYAALVAQNLGYDYQCHAIPGGGNLQIMESILLSADASDLCVVNWTWIDRFDFVSTENESWITLRPSLDSQHASYYFRHLHAQYRDILTNLVYISTAIRFLQHKKIPFMMTYMDSVLFENIRPEWHQPDAVVYLQQQIRPFMYEFDGKNFLDWSRDKSYEISDLWHPLEQAHAAAASYLAPAIDAILRRA
jgi:hypothetical protein